MLAAICATTTLASCLHVLLASSGKSGQTLSRRNSTTESWSAGSFSRSSISMTTCLHMSHELSSPNPDRLDPDSLDPSTRFDDV